MALTVLGRLRRFARLVSGSYEVGDELVAIAVAGFPRPFLMEDGKLDRLLGLYKLILDALPSKYDPALFRYFANSELERRVASELSELSIQERIIFILTAVERTTVNGAASLINMDLDEADSLVTSALTYMYRQPRRVLVVTDDDDEWITLSEELRDVGLTPAHARSVEEVAEAVRSGSYDLFVVDDVLTDEAAVYAIGLSQRTDAKLILTSDVTHVDEEGQDADVFLQALFHDRVRFALYVEPHTWNMPDATFSFLQTDDSSLTVIDVPDAETLPIVDPGALAPILAPIDAEVVAGRLTLAVGDRPASALPFSALDDVRVMHLRYVQELVDELGAKNTSPRILSRLRAVVDLLDRPLTINMVISLSVGIDALARVMPIVQEETMPLVAADIAAILLDLERFGNQFPAFRQYNAEAALARPITMDEDEALRSFVAIVLNAPNSAVAEDLKGRLMQLLAFRDRPNVSQASDAAWLRSISNLLRAISRPFASFGGDVAKEMRSYAIKGVATLAIASAGIGGLHVLGQKFPEEYGAVTTVLTRMKDAADKLPLSLD